MSVSEEPEALQPLGHDQGVRPVVASFTTKAPTIRITNPMTTIAVNGRMWATILGEVTAELRFLTREDCHLCAEALQLLHGIALEIIDIDEDPQLLARYDERVPVLIDPATGAVLMEGQFSPDQVRQLRRALSVRPPVFTRWRRTEG